MNPSPNMPHSEEPTTPPMVHTLSKLSVTPQGSGVIPLDQDDAAADAILAKDPSEWGLDESGGEGSGITAHASELDDGQVPRVSSMTGVERLGNMRGIDISFSYKDELIKAKVVQWTDLDNLKVIGVTKDGQFVEASLPIAQLTKNGINPHLRSTIERLTQSKVENGAIVVGTREGLTSLFSDLLVQKRGVK